MSKGDETILLTSRLHEAASGGDVNTLRQVLSVSKPIFGKQRSSIVNNIDANGYAALQKAAARGSEEIVRLLLSHGADASKSDFIHGNTALHEAAWKGYSRTVKLLIAAQAHLNQPNNGGFAPLHLCCQNGHNQTCRELLIAGCDPNIQNNYGDTPLHTSARYGHAGVTRILISAECHVSDQNKNGDTALHISAAMSRKKLTRILLEAGCDTTLRNKQLETALEIALRKDLHEIAKILNVTKSKTQSSLNPTDQIDASTSPKDKKRTNHETFRHWSPYGCHYYPDPRNFPQPNLDSLPHEPLKKGEQYYLDLAGNIRKGPIGVGCVCYCTPLFRQIETKLEKDKRELKAHIDKAHKKLNHKVTKLELKTAVQISELTKCIKKQRIDKFQRGARLRHSDRHHQNVSRHSLKLSRSRSLEVLDEFDAPDHMSLCKSLDELLDDDKCDKTGMLERYLMTNPSTYQFNDTISGVGDVTVAENHEEKYQKYHHSPVSVDNEKIKEYQDEMNAIGFKLSNVQFIDVPDGVDVRDNAPSEISSEGDVHESISNANHGQNYANICCDNEIGMTCKNESHNNNCDHIANKNYLKDAHAPVDIRDNRDNRPRAHWSGDLLANKLLLNARSRTGLYNPLDISTCLNSLDNSGESSGKIRGNISGNDTGSKLNSNHVRQTFPQAGNARVVSSASGSNPSNHVGALYAGNSCKVDKKKDNISSLV